MRKNSKTEETWTLEPSTALTLLSEQEEEAIDGPEMMELLTGEVT